MPARLRLSALPAPQRRLFPALGFTRGRFVLYGGTACALHLGHRESFDFDFFSSASIDRKAKRELIARLRPLGGVRRRQDEADTLGIELTDSGPSVLVSFFGGIGFPRLGEPVAAATGPRVASLLDLAGLKLAMAHQRHDENDLADLAALIEDGIPLDQAAGAMRRQYGAVELVAHAVAAAAWFDGRTPSPQGALTGERRQTLERAVAAWRGAVPALAVDDPALDAPGFRDAVLV